MYMIPVWERPQMHGRTYDGPVSCARDTKRIALYPPSHPLAQLGQPNPIHGILALTTTFPAQIQAPHKRVVVIDGDQVCKSRSRRAYEPLVKRPGTTWDREIPGCVVESCDEREPWCQFVCVVANEERARLEIGYDAGLVLCGILRRIEGMHV